MSDLVKRLRRAKGSELMPKILLGHKNAEVACIEAADRIEELERELAAEKEAHKACEFMMRTNASMAADLAVKLAAEKALADQGREVVQHWVEHSHHPCQLSDEFLAAYRKARGL